MEFCGFKALKVKYLALTSAFLASLMVELQAVCHWYVFFLSLRNLFSASNKECVPNFDRQRNYPNGRDEALRYSARDSKVQSQFVVSLYLWIHQRGR